MRKTDPFDAIFQSPPGEMPRTGSVLVGTDCVPFTLELEEDGGCRETVILELKLSPSIHRVVITRQSARELSYFFERLANSLEPFEGNNEPD